MRDIATKADIELLVREFYKDLLKISEIQPVFAHLDFEKHVPHMVQFWSFVLLDEEGYRTNVFDKHLQLPIQTPMFDTWLKVFTDTVDRLFTGEKADMAKQRATSLAYTFRTKWENMRGNG